MKNDVQYILLYIITLDDLDRNTFTKQKYNILTEVFD